MPASSLLLLGVTTCGAYRVVPVVASGLMHEALSPEVRARQVASLLPTIKGTARVSFVGEAEKLFKTVGRAMTILGESKERRRFDAEELHRDHTSTHRSAASSFRSRYATVMSLF